MGQRDLHFFGRTEILLALLKNPSGYKFLTVPKVLHVQRFTAATLVKVESQFDIIMAAAL